MKGLLFKSANTIAATLLVSLAGSLKADEGMVTQVLSRGNAGPHVAAIGDKIDVQTTNVDGWLIEEIEKGYLNDDPFIAKYWKDYGPLITTREFKWVELLLDPIPEEASKKYGAPLK